jgi:hypothetical protein
MTGMNVPTPRGHLPVYVAAPPGESEGYLAAAASLLHWGGRTACPGSVMRNAIARQPGRPGRSQFADDQTRRSYSE